MHFDRIYELSSYSVCYITGGYYIYIGNINYHHIVG